MKPRIADESLEKSRIWKLTEINDSSQCRSLKLPDNLTAMRVSFDFLQSLSKSANQLIILLLMKFVCYFVSLFRAFLVYYIVSLLLIGGWFVVLS